MAYDAVLRVKADIIKGATVVDTLTELVLDRVYQVSGLHTYDPSVRISIAMTATDAVNSTKVPQPGEGHPNYPPCIVVERWTSDPTYDIVNVFIRYRWRRFPAVYLKSVNGSLRTIPVVAQNPDGSPAMLAYTPTGSSSPIHVPAIIHKELLNGTTSFRFLEQIDPEQFNYDFAGCFNIDTWRGKPPRTLKILPVVGQSDDNVWYMNTYSIEYREDTWDEYVFYRDEFGQIPPAVANDVDYSGARTSGNGWQRLQGNGDPTWLVSFADTFRGKIDPGAPIGSL